MISDPSPSSPAVELFPWTTSPHTENIVIREEVTGTWGESQTFPVREAASGIEHTRPGGNLEGGTSGLLKASRGGHPRIERQRRFLTPQLRNSTGVKDRRDPSGAGLGWAGYPESLPLKGMLEFETVCWRKREQADMVTQNLPRLELRVGRLGGGDKVPMQQQHLGATVAPRQTPLEKFPGLSLKAITVCLPWWSLVPEGFLWSFFSPLLSCEG